MKQSLWRSGVVVGLAVVTVGLCNLFPNAAENSEAGMVLKLPGRDGVAGYVGYSLPPSEEEKKWLPKDTGLLKMQYLPEEMDPRNRDALEHGISASLILSGNDRRSLHRPQVCLRAQGWHIAKREVVTVKVAGQDLEVMDFTLRRKINNEDGTVTNVRAQYVYWWIGAKTTTPSDFKRILITVLDNMFKNINNRWGYPSVLVYADVEGKITAEEIATADAEAREKALGFVQNHAPLFQKSLGAQATE